LFYAAKDVTKNGTPNLLAKPPKVWYTKTIAKQGKMFLLFSKNFLVAKEDKLSEGQRS